MPHPTTLGLLPPAARSSRTVSRPLATLAAGRSSQAEQDQARFDALTFHDKDALRRFRDKAGRTWKSKIRELWPVAALDRHPDGDALRRVRNAVGQSGLDRIKL